MIKRTLILAATAASALALSAAPASASCTSDPTVPGCVNYAITTAENGVQTVLNIYNNVVQPEVNWAACLALHTATGKDC
jgi:hypothetical protein